MGQVRHGSATTTHAVGAAIQRSKASVAEPSREPGLNPKTVATWRKRQTVEDRKTGLREPRSTILRSHGGRDEQVVPFIVNSPLPAEAAALRNFDAFRIALSVASGG